MKSLKLFTATVVILAVLALLYLGVRLVPGAVVFALVRDLALDAGLDGYAAMAAALIVGFIPVALLAWRGFSWRKFGVLVLTIPLALSAYFAAKSFLHNRPGDVSNPDAVRWFGNDGQALLYYARQPDGVLIFTDRPGFHYRTGHQLQPVTAEIYQQWRQSKEKEAAKIQEDVALKERMERLASEAEAQRKALEAQIRASEDKLAEEQTARADTERKLQQQAEEALAMKAKLAREAHDAEEKRKELDTQMRASEEKVRQQNEMGKELQRRAEEAFAATTKIQTEVENAKRELKEQLGQRTTELDQLRQGVEARLRAAEDKLREEGEKKSKSEIQQQLKEAGALATRIQREMQEQKRRAEKAEAVASSQNSAVTIGIRNNTPFTMYVKFSSAKHSHVWQSPDRAWVIGPGQTSAFSLSGFPGERIYFAAWAAENPNMRWGMCAGMHEDQVPPAGICGAGDPPLLTLGVSR